MTAHISRTALKYRYRVSGDLVLDTALHLGGGRNPAKGTDSPILRDGFGKPYIPGSSLKGALRAAVERIAPNLNVPACGLYAPPEAVGSQKEGKNQKNEAISEWLCLTPLREEHPARKAYRELEESIAKPLSSELKGRVEKYLKSGTYHLHENRPVAEEHLLSVLDYNLCAVCKAFGAPFIGSAIYFHDASINEERWLGLTQVRDGVGIDRDSGRAVDRIKYDYEIVPPQTVFNFSMTIETGEATALGLAALALHELQQGNVPLGGIRSRGLGRCHLNSKTTRVEALDFANIASLKAYLTKNELTILTLDDFIVQHIKNLWQEQEASHV